MWKWNGTNIQMAEDDFGIPLPITADGVLLSETDTVKVTIKRVMNGETILEKTLTFTDNVTSLELTEAESERLPVGQYVYSADWYESGVFMCNLIPMGYLNVVDKA